MFYPLIGITCGEDDLNFFVRRFYAQAVEALGGAPVFLPSVQRRSSWGKFLEVLDGLILSGGVDVDPFFFGEEPVKGMGEITPFRDQFEIFFVKEFFPLNRPILAVCRGVQVLNVSLGGTIFQDIDAQVPNILKHFQRAPRPHPTHSVNVVPDTKLSAILPEEQWRVNSFHHQAVNGLAPGLVVSALAPDGIIEAIEGQKHPFALGVQWHPECNWQQDAGSFRLFETFISACRAGRHF
ncbi:gamma-glutamyl-gamma-aminobutyrate hydrolase family protein [Candidatus Formimonas warabiya]|uniref:Uncharacterized protein n=1 Tax=Formimonas warabiya TaxID=1761012 RepID=A0A3G1KSS6_FORW1|nr:gamma-glutamyl-gamma-aminobutyrate hydrolase family protein [Candidatus Formimonas warabiya]ATW25573.1 hypothetical protein DCMF_13125 [Candidatus Formimonas warabiya]